jgi:Holliday junction resolvasome RuvABC endonuclease subunit
MQRHAETGRPLVSLNILALDFGTRCGWAALKGGQLHSGAWSNPHSYSDSPGAFFCEFSKWLADMKRWNEPEHVVWEAPMIRHAPSEAWALMAAGMVTRVQAWAYRHQIVQLAGVRPNTLKKFTTGNGRADKPAMMAAMRVRWGWTGSDHNESDALAVLAWALETKR